MTFEEMVEKIVSKSGVTREQAIEALKKNNNDLLEAMIYVERTYVTPRNTYGSSGYDANRSNPQQDFSDLNNAKNAARENYEFKKTAVSLIQTLWKNQLAVSYQNTEIMSMPLLIWLLFFMVSASTLLLIIIISLFFDVRYYYKGVTMDSNKVNRVLDKVYTMINAIKKSLNG